MRQIGRPHAYAACLSALIKSEPHAFRASETSVSAGGTSARGRPARSVLHD